MVQNDADAFDFDENGRIGFGDVIELLGQVSFAIGFRDFYSLFDA